MTVELFPSAISEAGEKNAQQLADAIFDVIDGFAFSEANLALFSVALEVISSHAPSHDRAHAYLNELHRHLKVGLDMHFETKVLQ